MKVEDGYPENQRTVDTCRTLHSYLPIQQKKKLRVLRRIRHLLEDRSLNFLKPKHRTELNEFRTAVNLSRLKLEDLPESIKRGFREKDGRLGRIVYVRPRADAQAFQWKTIDPIC